MSKLSTFLDSHPLALWRDMSALGVNVRDVTRAVELGTLTKLAPGIYATEQAVAHPELEFAVAAASTGGVIARYTAAGIHHLIDKDSTERTTEILVPRSVSSRNSNVFPLTLLRTADPKMLSEGVEHRTILGVDVSTTSPARTIVDLIRGPIRQHAVTALAAFVTEGGDLAELRRLGNLFGHGQQIDDMIDAAEQVNRRPGP